MKDICILTIHSYEKYNIFYKNVIKHTKLLWKLGVLFRYESASKAASKFHLSELEFWLRSHNQ